MERLVASAPVLVHFFDFAQLNGLRGLPYVLAWEERYSPLGLRVLGIHSPRFPFSRSSDAVEAAVGRLGIGHPVAVDAERRVWKGYGCRGWPTLFLWGTGGSLLWHHLGEGDYQGTEEAIREALDDAVAVAAAQPDLLAPMRPSDAAGATVIPPSPEVFPGGSAENPWHPREDGETIELDYEAGGVYAAVDGRGELLVRIDGADPVTIAVEHPGLVELGDHPVHEAHRLTLASSGGVGVYGISFAPGIPA
ncbi:MAG: DipZ protein [Solirubrobacterales bacterium]|nr:DipZ protein [Solirubrobacterales bacterium]